MEIYESGYRVLSWPKEDYLKLVTVIETYMAEGWVCKGGVRIMLEPLHTPSVSQQNVAVVVVYYQTLVRIPQ